MRQFTVVTLLAVLFAAPSAHAGELTAAGAERPAAIRASIARVRFDTPPANNQPSVFHLPRHNGPAQKITAGFAMGVLGGFAGLIAGAAVEQHCACDPNWRGVGIGVPIGGIIGAVVGVKMVP